MNLEIAQKLYLAGFKTGIEDGIQITFPIIGNYVDLWGDEFFKFGEEWWRAPHVDELLAAFPDSDYFALEKDSAQRYRAVWDKKGSGDLMGDIFKNPADALADLWLTLKQNKLTKTYGAK